MRTHEIKEYDSVSQTLGEPGCPICTFLKNVQTKLLQTETPDQVFVLCNFHAWGIAAVRQAEDAAKIFLSLIDSPFDHENRRCSICLRLEQEETFRVRELIAKLSSRSVAGWLSKHGVLCIPHGLRLRAEAPESVRDLVNAVVSRTSREMRAALTSLIAEAAQGSTGHSGLLGRAAEYLVAQRGISLVRDQQVTW